MPRYNTSQARRINSATRADRRYAKEYVARSGVDKIFGKAIELDRLVKHGLVRTSTRGGVPFFNLADIIGALYPNIKENAISRKNIAKIRGLMGDHSDSDSMMASALLCLKRTKIDGEHPANVFVNKFLDNELPAMLKGIYEAFPSSPGHALGIVARYKRPETIERYPKPVRENWELVRAEVVECCQRMVQNEFYKIWLELEPVGFCKLQINGSALLQKEYKTAEGHRFLATISPKPPFSVNFTDGKKPLDFYSLAVPKETMNSAHRAMEICSFFNPRLRIFEENVEYRLRTYSVE